MDDQDLPTYDSNKDIGDPFSEHLGLDDTTETIELGALFTRDVTSSGSFDIKGGIWTTDFGKLVQALPIPALLIDQSYRVLVANQACARISKGYENIFAAHLSELFPESSVGITAVSLAQEVFVTRKPRVTEALMAIGNSTIWGRITLRSIRSGASRLLLLLVEDLSAEKRQLLLSQKYQEELQKEIAERKNAERAIARAKKQWERTFDAVNDLVAIIDKGYRIVRANRAMRECVGVPWQDMIGARCYECFRGTNSPDPACPHALLLADGKEHSAEIYQNGSGRVFDVTVFPIADDAGQLLGSVHVARNITARKEMEREREKLIGELTAAKQALHYQATHDDLTRVLNRPAILEKLQEERARAKRGNFPVGLLLIDLDHFKSVNDEYGHMVGDAVLRAVARRIRAVIRRYDAMGRCGGEEFMVILPGCDREKARGLAERLRMSFYQEPLQTREGVFHITLSCGVSVIERDSHERIDTFIRAADKALYRAKEQGRNRVELA